MRVALWFTVHLLLLQWMLSVLRVTVSVTRIARNCIAAICFLNVVRRASMLVHTEIYTLWSYVLLEIRYKFCCGNRQIGMKGKCNYRKVFDCMLCNPDRRVIEV